MDTAQWLPKQWTTQKKTRYKRHRNKGLGTNGPVTVEYASMDPTTMEPHIDTMNYGPRYIEYRNKWSKQQ